jgi:hypothetical protein
MRRHALALALAAALAVANAGRADEAADGAEGAAADSDAAAGDTDAAAEAEPEAQEPEAPEAAEAEEEEEEEPTAFDEYLTSVGERALTGLNGLLTAPADPPMAAVHPPEALEKASYARRPLGFASGILLMGYRVLTGAVDLGFALVPKMPVTSPVPRYKLIPGFEHEDE